jgi:hypothetical protein
LSDIAELFARDPLQCTKDDIKFIIEEYRKRQKQFNSGVMQAGNVKPKTSRAKKPGLDLNVDVGDL